MKRFDKKNREAPPSTRSGPRARAAQERGFSDRDFSDPYARADRPRADRPARAAPARNAVITLDPDVARVFRDSGTVNDALRMVIRLARFGAGRPAFKPALGRDQPRSPATPGRRFQRDTGQSERRRPPVRPTPRFDET
jgi:uncharacterized protein (DUF4415 family)